MKSVLFLSPGFPREMPFFVRGLARCGAQVIGVGEQPEEVLPPTTRRCLAAYHRLSSLWDEASAVAEIRRIAEHRRIDAVECLWEPGVMLAARLREELGLPGMGVEQATYFRDKEQMKRVLDRAGIRTPRHARATSEAECREAAERIGFPLIIKPIAGAGSADTHRVDDADNLERVIRSVRHVEELSVEEFIEGEEYTFDTICRDGEVLYENVSWYRPRPLIARSVEWISPQTIALRRLDGSEPRAGRQMGRAVLRALGFQTGFTHMEWFRAPDGEAVFGEIAARPPGALSVDLMNFVSDMDAFDAWAEALVLGRVEQPLERRFNAAVVFKRARGNGRIRSILGLERIVARYRPHIVGIDLLPPGTPRRNWKQTLLSDGHLFVRHPDLEATMEMADRIGVDLSLLAE